MRFLSPWSADKEEGTETFFMWKHSTQTRESFCRRQLRTGHAEDKDYGSTVIFSRISSSKSPLISPGDYQSWEKRRNFLGNVEESFFQIVIHFLFWHMLGVSCSIERLPFTDWSLPNGHQPVQHCPAKQTLGMLTALTCPVGQHLHLYCRHLSDLHYHSDPSFLFICTATDLHQDTNSSLLHFKCKSVSQPPEGMARNSL